MDKELYLPLAYKELYERLFACVVSNLAEAPKLLNELEESERFRTDYEFRAVIETARTIAYGGCGDFNHAVSSAVGLVDRTTALGLWELLSYNLNTLGNAYLMVGIYERALEYYYNVIQNEVEHNLNIVTSLAYFNIALVYISLDAYEKSYGYFAKAVNSLKEAGERQLRYHSKLMLYQSYFVPTLCLLDRIDEAWQSIRELREIREKGIESPSLYNYYIAEMYYGFFSGSYESARDYYLKAKEIAKGLPESRQADILISYVDLCNRFQLDKSYYEQELMEGNILEKEARPGIPVQLYMMLRQYYTLIDDKKAYEEATKRYVDILESHALGVTERQLASLQVVEGLLENTKELAKVSHRNNELQLIADEAIRNKNALIEAHHRIEIINEIGRKMTSSLKLEEVVGLIHQNLCNNIPAHVFILMAAEPEQNQLRSVAFYEGGKLRDEFNLSLDNEDSIFVECFSKNKMILLSDIPEDKAELKKKGIRIGAQVRSAIFMPLQVGENLIGACSVQSLERNVYSEEDLDFLKQLLPYLSIALNNAIRSWKLEGEIRSHLRTRVELEKANYRLELLSSLDGLTQISSRRDFETKILEMIRIAEEQKITLSIFMCDIDYFKMYNDTYGHLEGDEALKIVAKEFRKNMDTVNGLTARFGGEEFIGACIGLSEAESRKLANSICRDIYALNVENKHAPLKRLTISIGVSVADEIDISRKSDMVRLADTSLYTAKNTGKNRVVINRLSKESDIESY